MKTPLRAHTHLGTNLGVFFELWNSRPDFFFVPATDRPPGGFGGGGSVGRKKRKIGRRKRGKKRRAPRVGWGGVGRFETRASATATATGENISPS